MTNPFKQKRTNNYQGTAPASDNNSKPVIDKVLQFSAGTTIHGELVCPDSCYFNGKIFGNICIGSKLVLGESSEVLGNVSAKDLTVKGKVTGSIHVKNRVNFMNPSVSEGRKLETKFLEVENGASLNFDQVIMDPEKTIPEREDILQNQKAESSGKNPEKASPGQAKKQEPESDDLFLFNIFQNQS